MRRIVCTEEHQQYRETVRAFLVREATPHSERWEEVGYVDPAFWPKASAAGLLIMHEIVGGSFGL